MTAQEIIDLFPKKPKEGEGIEMFHSYDNMKQLEAAVANYHGSERAVAVTTMMQTILTVRNIIIANVNKEA